MDKIDFFNKTRSLISGKLRPVINGPIARELMNDEEKTEMETISKELEKQLDFFDKLTALLKGDVKSKSAEQLERESLCDSLKTIISRLFEETYKLDLFADDFNLRDFLAENLDHPLERMKEQAEKPWLSGKLTIGLVGHFSTGKTTALNLIFGEEFPIGRNENSALATYLTYGSHTGCATLVDSAGLSQEISLEQCRILDYQASSQDFPWTRIFSYLVKENSNEVLEKLTVIDTPGLASIHESHSLPTLKAIASCDAIFYFTKLAKNIGDEDIRFIKDNLAKLPLYVVFSFADARGINDKESAIQYNLTGLKEKGIECKDFLALGKKDSTNSEFKNKAFAVLQQLAKEHDPYNPIAMIMALIHTLEYLLVNAKKQYTEAISELDSKKDQLIADYSSSQRKFETEYKSCITAYNDMIHTFNDRCAGATFCGGAASAIHRNVDSISDSLDRIADAYKNMDESKIAYYGASLAAMGRLEDRLDKASGLLSEVQKLKDALVN